MSECYAGTVTDAKRETHSAYSAAHRPIRLTTLSAATITTWTTYSPSVVGIMHASRVQKARQLVDPD